MQIRRKTMLVIAGLAVVGLATQATAVAPERTFNMDDKTLKSVEWTSDTFAAAAPDFFLAGTVGEYECGATVPDNCEYSLFGIRGLSEEEIETARAQGKLDKLFDSVDVTIGIKDYSVPVSDLDIIVYESNVRGDKLAEMGRVGDLDTDPAEEWSGSVSTSGNEPIAYVLLETVFFAGAGTYKGYASIS